MRETTEPVLISSYALLQKSASETDLLATPEKKEPKLKRLISPKKDSFFGHKKEEDEEARKERKERKEKEKREKEEREKERKEMEKQKKRKEKEKVAEKSNNV